MCRSVMALGVGVLALACGVGLGAPIIANPSFEQNTFTAWPGYCSNPANGPITGWTGGSGLNPISDGQKPFVDNGAIPSSLDIGVSPNPTTGGQVAFIQVGSPTRSSLTQAISGLDPNASYVLEYRENARSWQDSAVSLDVTLSGQATDLVPDHTVRAVGGSDPFHYIRSRVFRPTSATETLSFSAWTAAGRDNTALIDNVRIIQITQHPSTVLFQDTFSDEFFRPDNYDINSQRPGTRQSGTVGSLPYIELTGSGPGGEGWRTQLDNPGRPDALLLAPGRTGATAYYPSIWACPDHDFVELPPAGRQVIEVWLDPHATRDWIALVFGTSRPNANPSPAPPIATNSNGFGFLLYWDGSWELYDRATLVDQGSVAAHAGFYDVRAEVDVLSYLNGSPISINMFVDDLLVASHAATASGSNYVLVEQYGSLQTDLTVTYADNLLIYNIDQFVPEPGTLAFMAAGLLVLRLRRRRSAGLR